MNKEDIIFILCIFLLYFLPKKSDTHKWFWIIPLAIFLITIGIRINDIYIKHENAGKMSALSANINNQKGEINIQGAGIKILGDTVNKQEAIIKKLDDTIMKQEAIIKNTEKEIKEQIEYGDIAQFNWHGFTSFDDMGFGIGTPYSNWYRDNKINRVFVRVKREGLKAGRDRVEFTWDCDTIATEYYKTKIKQMPRFPFPYVVLSGCLKVHGDPSWNEYAEVAKNILSKTIKVPGPHIEMHKFFLDKIEVIEKRSCNISYD